MDAAGYRPRAAGNRTETFFPDTRTLYCARRARKGNCVSTGPPLGSNQIPGAERSAAKAKEETLRDAAIRDRPASCVFLAAAPCRGDRETTIKTLTFRGARRNPRCSLVHAGGMRALWPSGRVRLTIRGLTSLCRRDVRLSLQTPVNREARRMIPSLKCPRRPRLDRGCEEGKAKPL